VTPQLTGPHCIGPAAVVPCRAESTDGLKGEAALRKLRKMADGDQRTKSVPLAARLRAHGPASLITAAFVLTLALGTVAIVLALLTPQQGILADMEYPADEVYAFDHLQIASGYLRLDIEAGLIVPTLRQDDVAGVVIFGLGVAYLTLPGDLAGEMQSAVGFAALHEEFEVLYLRTNYQSLRALKSSAGAVVTDEPEHLALAQDILDLQVADPGLLPLFGVPAPGEYDVRPTAVRLYTSSYGRLDYAEGPRIVIELSRPILRTVSLPNPGYGAPAFPGLYAQPVMPATILLYAVLAAMLFVLSFALTLHINEPEWALRAQKQGSGLPMRSTRAAAGPPYLPTHWIFGLLIAYFALTVGSAALFGKNRPVFLTEAALGLAVAGWLYRQRVPFRHLGITGWAARPSLIAGALVGFYVVVAGSLSYPSGIRSLAPAGWLVALARSLLLVAPAREIILRAVAQTGLERYAGRVGSIALPAVVGGLAYLGAGLVGYAAAGRQLEPLLMEGLLVVPTVHALAGYLYRRTRNLLAPWLVTALAELLPQVLAF